jgi:hypothetical protein
MKERAMSNPTTRQIVGGAIYDFAARLTCRKDPITMGAAHNAAPAAEACDEFLKLRGCAEGEPLVTSWQEHLSSAPTPSVIKPEFRADIEHLINRHSMENGSDTPDFILATYLCDCLEAFDKAAKHREAWYGRGNKSPIAD